MKRSWRVGLSALTTAALAYWVVTAGRDDREIWLALGAWLLGFWLASSLLRESDQGGSQPDEGDFEPEDDDSEEYEDWE